MLSLALCTNPSLTIVVKFVQGFREFLEMQFDVCQYILRGDAHHNEQLAAADQKVTGLQHPQRMLAAAPVQIVDK